MNLLQNPFIETSFSVLIYQALLCIIVVVFLLTIPLNTAKAENNLYLTESYKKSNDYKAIAQAFINGKPILKNGLPVLGYTWNYDTAKDSVRAATAYCIKLSDEPRNKIQCKIIFLGTKPVPNNDNIETLIIRYEQQVINDLTEQLKKTGERELVTRLSTILQKTGYYKLSEDLLIDLAMNGEHLAQNALAYHWAELSINLPMALSFSNNAVSKDPNFFSYHDTRSLVLFRLGQTKEALKASAHAISLSQHPIAIDHYGDILWKTGHETKAVEQWKKSISVSKDILFIQRLQLKIKNGMTQDIIFE